MYRRCRSKVSRDDRSDAIRQLRIVRAERAMQRGFLRSDRGDRYLLVMHAQRFFHRMGKRRVAHVVKQRRGAHRNSIRRRNRIVIAQSIQNARDQMQRAEAVREA